jgi:hypothetical protein
MANIVVIPAQASPGTPVTLVIKGVDFGSITYYDTTGDFDVSGVVGIDDDLVVRPFCRKGEFIPVHAFDVEALQFHMGMQAQELVGELVGSASADADLDGVTDEVLVGELSVMHIFGQLSAADQDDLLIFLNSLRTPMYPAKGIDQPMRYR